MADNLTWLARNAHLWPEIVPGRAFAAAFAVEGLVEWLEYPPVDWDGCYQKHEWLARRSELQNKPSWKDAPQDASYLAQEPHGMWTFFFDRPYEPSKLSDDGWRFDGFQAWCSECRGEVLGDWRDTLERRPVDLSEPAGGVKERGADGAEEINAMAQRLLVALKNDPRSFDTGALAEMVELADAEIVKRDAAVCCGEGYLNNHWFERGELPPIGIECTAVADGIPDANCIIIAISIEQVVVKWTKTQLFDVLDMPGWSFRPTRTERDKAIDEMKQYCPYHGSWDTVGRIYAEALYDAGYRKQVLPAK